MGKLVVRRHRIRFLEGFHSHQLLDLLASQFHLSMPAIGRHFSLDYRGYRNPKAIQQIFVY